MSRAQQRVFAILKVLIPLLLAGLIALYVYQVGWQGKDPTQNLFQLLVISAGLIATLVKIYTGSGNRRSLHFYETTYQSHLEGAFVEEKNHRKELLQAVRLYNEDRFDAALRRLESLKPHCTNAAEHRAVGLFTALVFTDGGQLRQAAALYEEMIGQGLGNATLHCNLGYLYDRMGERERAKQHLEESLFFDPRNESALNNLAQGYFHEGDLEKAEDYAKRALESNDRFRPASNLLALIYALREQEPEAERYFRLAVANGEDPQNLRLAIQRFRAER